MDKTIKRNLGEQPLASVLRKHALRTHDIVAASGEQITHKMVSKACKGRRLTKNVQAKIIRAVNQATQNNFRKDDLFNY